MARHYSTYITNLEGQSKISEKSKKKKKKFEKHVELPTDVKEHQRQNNPWHFQRCEYL
jgi:hypothetical protein